LIAPALSGPGSISGIEEVLVLGAGSIGREIALQCAMCGYRATLHDISREALHEARARIMIHARALSGTYVDDPPQAIIQRIYFTLDLEEAMAAADLVSECAPEDPGVKRRLFARIAPLAPPHTIFTTNTSSLTPSALADATGRPERFLALHFHKPVWVASIADVMPHPGTRADVIATAAAFARSLRQRTIVLAKETPGYVFNAMLQAYTGAALLLWAHEVASFEDIDRAWMIAESAARGPFAVMDAIGLDVVHDTIRCQAAGAPHSVMLAARLKAEFIDHGRLGVKTGEGFYRYPDPAFGEADFLAR
jgi:3-hydroxybutyryl-CoA dehydrogenase